jgi:hypothetical protein
VPLRGLEPPMSSWEALVGAGWLKPCSEEFRTTSCGTVLFRSFWFTEATDGEQPQPTRAGGQSARKGSRRCRMR